MGLGFISWEKGMSSSLSYITSFRRASVKSSVQEAENKPKASLYEVPLIHSSSFRFLSQMDQKMRGFALFRFSQSFFQEFSLPLILEHSFRDETIDCLSSSSSSCKLVREYYKVAMQAKRLGASWEYLRIGFHERLVEIKKKNKGE